MEVSITGNVYDGLSIEGVIELVSGYARTKLCVPKDLRDKLRELQLLEVLVLDD